MKLLIVCSGNSGKIVPYIVEQTETIAATGIQTNYFLIEGKGVSGYLKNRKKLLKHIKEYNPQLIHAHYGLSGLLANLQRKIPVVTTYHGSDINNPKIFPFSRLSMILSAYNIFVSDKNRKKSKLKTKQSLIPCAVNIDLFKPFEKKEARKLLGIPDDKKVIVFAGAFNNTVKNAPLAKAAVALLPYEVSLIELKGFSRENVVVLLNAADVALMTSFTEGSPQFIKEAMACNCPIVSVEVGDVSEVVDSIQGCFISGHNANAIAENLKKAFDFGKKTNGRQRIIDMELDAQSVTRKITKVYKAIMPAK